MNLAEKLVRYHQENPERLLQVVFEVIEDDPEVADKLTRKIRDIAASIEDDPNSTVGALQ